MLSDYHHGSTIRAFKFWGNHGSDSRVAYSHNYEIFLRKAAFLKWPIAGFQGAKVTIRNIYFELPDIAAKKKGNTFIGHITRWIDHNSNGNTVGNMS